MRLNLESFKKAVGSLQRAIDVATSEEKMSRLDKDQKDTMRAGVIQNFEFTYELSWKFMKRWLEHNVGSVYVDGLPRRELFRVAAEHQLIEHVDQWIIYHDARNETAHTYEEKKAREIFENARQFLKDAQFLLDNLERKND